MQANRSMPSATLIPELDYPDVREAVDWMCRVFGFVERLRIANHRAQVHVGDAALVVTQRRGDGARSGQVLMVRIDDVDAHCERARRGGARIAQEPTSFPYGERQYTAEDPAGHRWVFSQTLADVDPASWGGELVSAHPR